VNEAAVAGNAMEREPRFMSCVILVDKPVGPTSFDIVRAVRQGVRMKVGHAGTLDPFATGLLLVLVGQATRIFDLLMVLPKQYEVTVQFGAVSSTADPTGDITPTGIRVEEERVRQALDSFRGPIKQRVPMTSAVKIDGEALYRKAHRGESVETPEREVVVHDLRLLHFDEAAQTAQLAAITSSGTYVRTLAEDLGAALGAGAYAASLRRTRCGDLDVAAALSPEELSPERYTINGRGVLSVDDALGFLPVCILDEKEAKMAANGAELRRESGAGLFRVHGPGGLLGVYEGRSGTARPRVIFASSL
jgi:tRNA pseudouridine55 synthase